MALSQRKATSTWQRRSISRELVDPGRVGEQQELEHHGGVIGRGARGLYVAVVDRRQVEQLVDHLGDEAGLVVLGQPVVERGRQQERLGLVVVRKVFAVPVGVSFWAGNLGFSASKSLSPTRSLAMGKFLPMRWENANREALPSAQPAEIRSVGRVADTDPRS